jgi:outer membrane protein OmpA-like peptidoglycan-associated protein
MFGSRAIVRRGNRDEAEKPFWISFADLMTALMVLFLVVMGVALLAVTKSVTDRERKVEQHRKNIELILERFEQAANRYEGIRVDKKREVIDFGQRAQFDFNSDKLNSGQQEVLRRFVPEVLTLANDELGRSVLKRFVVEGYTDRTGTYLANLKLSLNRSQRVLCALFERGGLHPLSQEQQEQVRNLFFVGGYSFNSAKETPAESRRVEIRLEFLGVDEPREAPMLAAADFGVCGL